MAVDNPGSFIALTALVVALFGNIGVATNAQNSCERIERINERIRTNAKKNYDDLEQNVRLIGIELTPEIRAKALSDYKSTLREYAPRKCVLFQTP